MKKHGKNSFLGRYADIVIHYRYVIVVATVLVCILLGLGKSRIGFSSDYHYYFGQMTPEIEAMEELDKTYANSDSIYFAVSPQDGGTVFKREILSAVAELTDKAWLMPFVIRVDSVVNFQHTRVVGEDDLIVEDLVREPTKLTAVRLEAIKQEALAEPFLISYHPHSGGFEVAPHGGAYSIEGPIGAM